MIRKQCIVIGLGRFGFSVAENLSKLGHDVLAVDIDEDRVKDISHNVSHAICADIQDTDIIESLGVENFDVAVVAIGGDVESSCMAIIGLKNNGVKHIIAKAKSETSGKILSAVGADKVIFPERDMGVRVANNIFSTNIIDFLELSNQYSIVEISTPLWSIGKSVQELKIREKFNLNIVAIKNNHEINASIMPSTIIKDGDKLIVIGKDKHIHNFK